MLEKFRSFELDKKEQKNVKGSGWFPNWKACAVNRGLWAGSAGTNIGAAIGIWVHC